MQASLHLGISYLHVHFDQPIARDACLFGMGRVDVDALSRVLVTKLLILIRRNAGDLVMYKKVGACLLAGLLAALALSDSPAAAQRDAGAKLRGDTGRYSGRTGGQAPRVVTPRPGFGYAAQPGAARPSNSPQPSVAAAQPQASAVTEAYSIAPLPFEIGDDVQVTAELAQLMRGRSAIGGVPAGTQLRVLQIRGPWVGVAAVINGREVGGWLWYSQVAPTDSLE